jgi:hypothetical protein
LPRQGHFYFQDEPSLLEQNTCNKIARHKVPAMVLD